MSVKKIRTKDNSTSINKRVTKVCGYRRENGQPLFQPCELGYSCPICGCANEELCWSEYNYFLWCPVCNADIPSCLCVKYTTPRLNSEPLDAEEVIAKATKTFLDCIEDMMKNNGNSKKQTI